MNTWREDIIEALTQLGGKAHYTEIYEAVKKIRGEDKLPKSWKQIVQRVIEASSEESANYDERGNIFYSVDGIGSGTWGLVGFENKKKSNIVNVFEEELFFEGTLELKQHLVRERNHSLVEKAKERFLEQNGRLFCEICKFDFEKAFGEIGIGFIEAHHKVPISERLKNESTKISDLMMLCSNCHRMIHRAMILDKKNKL